MRLLHSQVSESSIRLSHNAACLCKEMFLLVSRNTISFIETGQFNPTAKLVLVLCIALDKKFEDLFFF